MRKPSECLLVAALMLLGASAHAMGTCPSCVLGIYDDLQLQSNMGTIQMGVPKSLYLGIQYGAGFDRATGIEFSIAGLGQPDDGILVLGVNSLLPGTGMIGSVPAPVDTSAASTGTGGIDIAWPSCPIGAQALVQMYIMTFTPQHDRVFQVKRRYPTTNPTWHTPVMTLCDEPAFTPVRIGGGCYLLGWSGDPQVPCIADGVVATNAATWSTVKALYH